MQLPSANEVLQRLVNNKKNIVAYDDVLLNTSFYRREIMLGDIDMEVGESIEALIRFWNTIDDENNVPVEERQPIIIHIDSNGGDLDATFTMVDAIRMSKTPVWTVNIGCAFSGGFFTFIAGHKRVAYPHSTFLYHEGSTGQIADAGKFQNYAEFYKVRMQQLRQLVLDTTDVDEELYKEKRRDDWWLTAEDAKELGMVDEITQEFI